MKLALYLLPICLLAQTPPPSTAKPAAAQFYVVGGVTKPGVYSLDPNKETTLLTALALFKGALPNSAKNLYIYRKNESSTEREEIRVDLAHLLQGKADNLTLKAGDILYIPETPHHKPAAHLRPPPFEVPVDGRKI